MTTWVLGDVHGQLPALERLLPRLDLGEDDHLWMVGDLVNRGPDSVGVLRWARRQADARGERFRVVLGNHDLRVVAWHLGIGAPRANDTVEDVLEAADRDELVEWLRGRDLLLVARIHAVVHAGVSPRWPPEEAEARARRSEGLLRGPDCRDLLCLWTRDEAVGGSEEVREAAEDLRWLTKVRCVRRLENGAGPGFALCDHKGPPEEAPTGCVPWYSELGSSWRERRILFGHWAAHGMRETPGAVCLDAGAAWGGAVAALCLDDGRVLREPV